jgi:hypothetical protein
VWSTLYIVDNCSKIIYTLVNGSQLFFEKQWCKYIVNVLFWLTLLFIYGFCMICIHILYILLVECNSSMTRKMNSSMNRWMMSKWMNATHPFLNVFCIMYSCYTNLLGQNSYPACWLIYVLCCSKEKIQSLFLKNVYSLGVIYYCEL